MHIGKEISVGKSNLQIDSAQGSANRIRDESFEEIHYERFFMLKAIPSVGTSMTKSELNIYE